MERNLRELGIVATAHHMGMGHLADHRVEMGHHIAAGPGFGILAVVEERRTAVGLEPGKAGARRIAAEVEHRRIVVEVVRNTGPAVHRVGLEHRTDHSFDHLAADMSILPVY